jgi:hypothetical protein
MGERIQAARPRRVLQSARLQMRDEVSALVVRQNKRRAAIADTLVVETALPPLPNAERRYVPIRERSLHASVRHTSLFKRRVSRRWGRK